MDPDFNYSTKPSPLVVFELEDAVDGTMLWRNDTAGSDRRGTAHYGGMSPQGYLLAAEGQFFHPKLKN